MSTLSTYVDNGIPLELISHRRHIRVGQEIAKYFGDTLYLGRIRALPGPGEKYYEIEYDDGDAETMTEIKVLRGISLYKKEW